MKKTLSKDSLKKTLVFSMFFGDVWILKDIECVGSLV